MLQVKTFKDYIDLYIKGKEDDSGSPIKVIYEQVNPRWEIAVTLSDSGFRQVSFVNSIATTKVSCADHRSILGIDQVADNLPFCCTYECLRCYSVTVLPRVYFSDW